MRNRHEHLSPLIGVELKGLAQQYSGDAWVLRDVDVRLERGVTALVGVNGAGKSTLLSTLAGSLPPTRGTVLVGGRDLYGKDRRQVLSRVALMPQALTLPQNLTTLEAVSVIGWMRGLKARTVRAEALTAIAAVGLEEHSKSRIGELSGGMKRRVALAQAVVSRPDVLLLDEPSTGLDPQQRRRMVDIIKGLSGTVLFSSHVMEDVTDTAERVLILHEGQLRFDGSTKELEGHAPTQADEQRKAEAGFLQIITARAAEVS